jgi:hypothetical protein
MNVSTLEELAARIGQLERENRRWKQVAAMVLLGASIMLLTGQSFSRPALIEAEQLAIRDASGRVRVLIRALGDGPAVLTFRDELERDRVAIGVIDDGTPMLSFYDEHRRRRLALGVFPPAAVGMHLFGRDGTGRSALAIRSNDMAALEFSQAGVARASVTLDEGDPPRLSVLAAKGTPLIQLPPGLPK